MAAATEDPDLAIAAGTRLCEQLLKPLQDAFGRTAVRSAFRSSEVNGFGNRIQKKGKKGYSCASNEANYADHIWDKRDADGYMGAKACVIVPSFWDKFQSEGDRQKLAWWIHDHLPYSSLEFFPRYWAFNIKWHEIPKREIHAQVAPKDCLTSAWMENNAGSHEAFWRAMI